MIFVIGKKTAGKNTADFSQFRDNSFDHVSSHFSISKCNENSFLNILWFLTLTWNGGNHKISLSQNQLIFNWKWTTIK